MYPRISDLINDLLGTQISLPIQSYGFFVAMAFLAGAFFLHKELGRKEKEGILIPQPKKTMVGKPASPIELILSFIISLVAAYKIGGFILDYSAFTNNPQAYVFSGHGSWWLGILLAAAYTYLFYFNKNKKKKDPPIEEVKIISPKEHTWPMVFVAVIFGIFGAKVFHWFENWGDFIADPLESLLSFSGLTFYGGLITAAFAVGIYGEKNKIPWRHLADSISPSLILAYGIGRIGCQVAGDGDWGIVNHLTKPEWLGFLPDWVWAYNYPHNIIQKGVPIEGCSGAFCFQLPEAVFPTPIYETTMAIIIFVFLWSIRKHLKIPGILTSIYLICNGLERFLIEKIRVNNIFDFFGMQLTQAEIISSIFILSGIIMGLVFYLTDKKRLAHES